ncbi:LexA repressor [Paenibacillus antibioticophila]|uniref:LexA repressor n=1 Tax=Paenibacillus antibioticophila TaxID=1274374 RepID=A0A919XPM5_9BACL|nr:LexA family transcriptional regulator [Paenibacillus antibioticophila]GIO36917.1 LexA repressor [Paenibacillus antibioticophila]
MSQLNYYELLKSYIKDSGLSLSEISERLKEYGYQVSKGYISQLQNGKTDNPATTELNRALAKVTGGNIETLLTAALIEKAPDEIKNKFERLTMLKSLREEYVKAQIIQEESPKYIIDQISKVPLLGSIAAGQPIERLEHIEDVEFVNKSLIRNGEAFALRVKGDSMIGDNITDGDIVICLKQTEVSATDIAVVAVDNETATIKRVKHESEMCLLMPSNPKMQPILVHSSKVQIIGRVIEVRRRF